MYLKANVPYGDYQISMKALVGRHRRLAEWVITVDYKEQLQSEYLHFKTLSITGTQI